MGRNIYIITPCYQASVRPRFIAYGEYRVSNTVIKAGLSVTLQLFKGTHQIGNDVTASITDCTNSRWRYEFGVTTPLATGNDYRLVAILKDNNSELDRDASSQWSVETNADEYQLIACPGAEKRSFDAENPIGTDPKATDDAAKSKGCGCCPAKLQPKPYNHYWDFLPKWSPDIVSGVCIVRNTTSGVVTGVTPATIALGRCVAQILVPVQVDAENYSAQFVLFGADGVTAVLNSTPVGLPRNW